MAKAQRESLEKMHNTFGKNLLASTSSCEYKYGIAGMVTNDPIRNLLIANPDLVKGYIKNLHKQNGYNVKNVDIIAKTDGLYKTLTINFDKEKTNNLSTPPIAKIDSKQTSEVNPNENKVQAYKAVDGQIEYTLTRGNGGKVILKTKRIKTDGAEKVLSEMPVTGTFSSETLSKFVDDKNVPITVVTNNIKDLDI